MITFATVTIVCSLVGGYIGYHMRRRWPNRFDE